MAKHLPASSVLLLAGSIVILLACSASSDERRGARNSTSSAQNTDDKTTSLPANGADDRHFSKHLTLQMTDEFRAKLDTDRWRKIQGNTRTENGSCLM